MQTKGTSLSLHLHLQKVLRKAPQAIATEIVEAVSDKHIERAEAMGPYANFFLERSAFADEVLKKS